MTELTRQCLALSPHKRAQLIRTLEKSLMEATNEDEIIKNRFSTLLSIVESMVGKGIIGKLKDRELVIGRRLIAYQMRLDGFSLSKIGMLLGKHHATVQHMEKMMEDAIKFEFRPELTYWEEFQQKLKEYEREISSEVV